MAETTRPSGEAYPHTPDCSEDNCICPDDVFWGRLLGDDDPCAPGKDWAAAAFGELEDEEAEEESDGCDCAELCSMGPTCPGGGLAGLPGSGCWRTRGDA